MICRAKLDAMVLAFCLFAGPVLAQETDETIDAIGEAGTICADAPDSVACAAAQLRSEALMVMVVAEAGESRDRGAYIDLVRAVLNDPSPEVRTSALYALAKLQPDATDTPAILALLRDPVSNVRAGAWAAGSMSTDPAARLVVRRAPERPDRNGYAPDDPARAFVADAPGCALPEEAEYLRLTQGRRDQFQLDFLTTATQADVLAWAATLGAGPAIPLTDLLASDPATASLALGFLDALAFGDPFVLRLPPVGDRPQRLVLIYRDILFDQTGIAVVFGDQGSLVPPEPATDVPVPDPEVPLDDTAVDAPPLDLSGFKSAAPEEESDLFASILTAYGYGADDYLELYPEGAYASEARAILSGPRLILDDLAYTETDIISASFANLPVGATAELSIMSVLNDYATEASQYVPDTGIATQFDTEGRLGPGVYLMSAEVWQPDGPPIGLRRDFSITAAMAELATDKTDFAPGEAITVRFSGMSGDDQDYVSTAPAGSENGNYETYVYTGGVREGSVTLLAPTTPGNYELRAFFREDESVLRASMPITVGGAAPSQDGVTQPDAMASQDGIVPPAGDPSPDARATIALDKATYAPGETILVTYSSMFGDPYDYVATVTAGAPLNAYLNYAYTQGALEGTATLTAPGEPGAYEVRAFFKEDEAILRGSVAFEVR